MSEITYKIQGSAPHPYLVKINMEPLTIACDCSAGMNGLPCRHRKSILSGENTGIIEGDISHLPKIKKIAESINIFETLKKYDDYGKKKNLKKLNTPFKNYYEARVALALKKVKTDKAVIKYRMALEAAIDENLEAEKAFLEIDKAVKDVFIRPLF